jgi:tRNA(Ile)-lysidine synthase
LRPEADEEEVFLENIWKKLWFQVEIWSANIKEIQKLYPSISIEELARKKRYDFLWVIRDIYKSPYVLTAHHLDDKIETFLFNLARGSKLTWFINMTEKSWLILRPLLHLEKAEILKYLDENWLEYRIDKTNLDNNITRNFLRNEIVPNLSKINTNFKNNISNTLSYFEELKNFIDEEIKRFLWSSDYFCIKNFNKEENFLKKEIIRYIFFIRNWNSTIWLSESLIKEILKFINGKNNKTIKEIKNLKMKKDWDKIYF